MQCILVALALVVFIVRFRDAAFRVMNALVNPSISRMSRATFPGLFFAIHPFGRKAGT